MQKLKYYYETFTNDYPTALTNLGSLGPYCKVIADHINLDGIRIMTAQVRFHRIIMAELNTHRAISKSAASSRAIPVKKMLQMVTDHPAIPLWWGMNEPGMQANTELEGEALDKAKNYWLHKMRVDAIEDVRYLAEDLNLHKQIANRALESWMWAEDIISFTDPSNMFHQRCHPDAQPEFQALANTIQMAWFTSKPTKLDYGRWVMPYIREDDYEDVSKWMKNPLVNGEAWDFYKYGHKLMTPVDVLKRISTARCARVSFLNHNGVREIESDINMFYNKLQRGGHWTPYEHVYSPCDHYKEINKLQFFHNNSMDNPTEGRPSPIKIVCSLTGNFGRGWHQFRKEFDGENRRAFRPNLQELAHLGITNSDGQGLR